MLSPTAVISHQPMAVSWYFPASARRNFSPLYLRATLGSAEVTEVALIRWGHTARPYDEKVK